MASPEIQRDLRPAAFLAVPRIDFVSVLVASGFLSARFENHKKVTANTEIWESRFGEPVMFPCPHDNERNNLRRRTGVIDEIDIFNGNRRCMVRVHDTNSRWESRVLQDRWFPLAQPLNFEPDLEARTRGTLMVEEAETLESILGQAGVCELLSERTKACCILDVKNRVHDEVKEAVTLSQIGHSDSQEQLVLRDLVRLESAGPIAMSETSCAQVRGDADPGWELTVFGGGLKFLPAQKKLWVN